MLAELLKKRAAAFDLFKELADKPTLTEEETTEYGVRKRAVEDLDGQIKRAKEAQALAAENAQPVAGQEPASTPATVKRDAYETDRTLVIGGAMNMLARSNGLVTIARTEAISHYGENHPVSRALITSSGAAGGFIVPPDYMPDVIELLRNEAVVRAAGPRTIPMPRGTMTLPGQASAATARYGAEGSRIRTSQPSFNQIVASFKKLTGLVPVSNDMMRYANPAIDGVVRDDLVQVLALEEDYHFMFGLGTQDTPRGWLSFASGYAIALGGAGGNFLTSANSTAASGGNFITSTASYTLATVAAELGGAVNKLDAANVKSRKRCWFMNPRSYNYLYNVQNSLGVYVYRDELEKGKLLGYPLKWTNQIGTNYYNADGSHTDCSFVFLVEMTEDMIFDSMSLELAVSREGTYVDASGNTVSAFQNDETLIRAIAEHDHQMRHDAAVAVIQFVRWAPAIA